MSCLETASVLAGGAKMSNAEVLKIVKKVLEPEYHEDMVFITEHDIFMEEECEEDFSLCGTDVKGSKVWYVNTSNCLHRIVVAVYKLVDKLCVSFRVILEEVTRDADIFFAIGP